MSKISHRRPRDAIIYFGMWFINIYFIDRDLRCVLSLEIKFGTFALLIGRSDFGLILKYFDTRDRCWSCGLKNPCLLSDLHHQPVSQYPSSFSQSVRQSTFFSNVLVFICSSTFFSSFMSATYTSSTSRSATGFLSGEPTAAAQVVHSYNTVVSGGFKRKTTATKKTEYYGSATGLALTRYGRTIEVKSGRLVRGERSRQCWHKQGDIILLAIKSYLLGA